MAKRPDDARGALIFQEGKCIEGDYYIIAVYDDPATCTISFSAYELENDCTYTYPLTYSEFDALFKFDSELMIPSNQDGRFHWVIERLDFVSNARGVKVLCLAQEPTPEIDDEDDLLESPAQKQSVAPAHSGGKIDAATRAKLLKELDTQDDEKLHTVLVKSEGARKRFLADLHAKRQLEQLKASQRLLKADEEREERLAKLELIKKQQQEKAQKHLKNAEARRNTQAQLEVLLKQKEAQAIRRLIQEKDEQDRGMGREKDAARARRKMQERSAGEIKGIEEERAKQLQRKRDDQVARHEQMVSKKNRLIAEQVREVRESTRAIEVRRRETKDQVIQDTWTSKKGQRRETERKRAEFDQQEEVRDRMNLERDRERAHHEREHLLSLRGAAEQEEAEKARSREKLRKDYLLQWRIQSMNRAMSRRSEEKVHEKREAKRLEKEDQRLRRFRESQFLDTVRGRSMSPTHAQNMQFDDEEETMRATSQPPAPCSPGATTDRLSPEATAFQRTFEQQERQRRQAEREERRKHDEAKRGKVEQLSGKDPNVTEVLRIRQWRQEEERQKQAAEEARTAREVAQEKATRVAMEQITEREQKFAGLEQTRRERSLEREAARMRAVVDRTRNVPIGMGLPSVLAY